MKPLSAYPVTFPFGATTSPYSASNPHKGDDHAAPLGTPVDVNGVTIGLVGSTGYSTGNHCHIGRFVNGQPTNPKGGGFKFNSAVVTQIAQDNTNGKYVRIDADGASWVYLHLSDNSKVKVGQALKGNDMFEGKTAQEWATQAKDAEQYKQQVIKTTAWARGMGMKVGNVQFVVDDLQKFKDEALANPPKPPGTVELKPGIYEVKE